MNTYRIEWLGVTAYISAANGKKARAKAMKCAYDANMWHAGKSMKGLTCRRIVCVPPGETVVSA